MRTRKIHSILAAGALAVLAAPLSAGSTEGTKPTTLYGYLAGEHEVTIKAKSQGEITSLLADEGASVQEGDMIAVIDDRQELSELKLAKAELATAKSDYEKTRKLTEYLSEDEVEKKKNEFIRKESNLELKSLNLANARVRAPIAGTVTRKYFDKGETVSVGDKIFELVQVDKLVIEVYLPTSDLQKVRVGQELKFRTEIDREKLLSGTVSYLSPTIDAASGTVKMKISVPNPKGADGAFTLKPGVGTIVEI